MCPDCHDHGVVHIRYRIDRGEQLAYCRCPKGAQWKRFGAVVVRARFGLPADYPVTELAWVTGDLMPLDEAPVSVQRAFKLAGLGKRTAVRAERRTGRDRRRSG